MKTNSFIDQSVEGHTLSREVCRDQGKNHGCARRMLLLPEIPADIDANETTGFLSASIPLLVHIHLMFSQRLVLTWVRPEHLLSIPVRE